MKIVSERGGKYEFGFDSGLGIVKLRGFFFDRIGNRALILEDIVDYAAGMCNIGVVALDFDCPVDHSADGLVNNDGGMRVLHDLVYLVTLGANEQGDHSFRDEDNDGEGLGLDFFEFLVDIVEEELTTLKFLLHLSVINLRILQLVLEYYAHSNQG